MRFDLRGLRTAAHKDGWALGFASLLHVKYAANLLGWKEVRARHTDRPVTELRPVDQERSKPRSLSTIYGLGEQPLHTDGAHLRHPPDLVVLFAEEPNDTSTLLWDSRVTDSSWVKPWQAIRHGVFLIDNGRDSFYATASLDGFAIRYDPGCMVPCDERARMAASYFGDAGGEAKTHRWEAVQSVLLIDNRYTLHARGDASAAGAETRLLQRIMYSTSESR